MRRRALRVPPAIRQDRVGGLRSRKDGARCGFWQVNAPDPQGRKCPVLACCGQVLGQGWVGVRRRVWEWCALGHNLASVNKCFSHLRVIWVHSLSWLQWENTETLPVFQGLREPGPAVLAWAWLAVSLAFCSGPSSLCVGNSLQLPVLSRAQLSAWPSAPVGAALLVKLGQVSSE